MTDAEAVALKMLAEIAVVPPGGLKPEHSLARDLKVDGDDYGMTFVRELQRRLDFHAPRREWEIGTVQELLEIVRRHTSKQKVE